MKTVPQDFINSKSPHGLDLVKSQFYQDEMTEVAQFRTRALKARQGIRVNQRRSGKTPKLGLRTPGYILELWGACWWSCSRGIPCADKREKGADTCPVYTEDASLTAYQEQARVLQAFISTHIAITFYSEGK